MSKVKFYKGNSQSIFYVSQSVEDFNITPFEPESFILTEDTGELYYYSEDYQLEAISYSLNNNYYINHDNGDTNFKNWDKNSEYFTLADLSQGTPVDARPVTENGTYVLLDLNYYEASDPFQFSMSQDGSTKTYSGQGQFLTNGSDYYIGVTIVQDSPTDYFMKVSSLDDPFYQLNSGRYILCQVVPKKLHKNPEWEEW